VPVSSCFCLSHFEISTCSPPTHLPPPAALPHFTTCHLTLLLAFLPTLRILCRWRGEWGS
jgi:hypothetical protein